MNFQEFMKNRGVSYQDFKKPEEIDNLINEYAKYYLSMYYGM